MTGFSGAITLDNPGRESAKNKDNATYHFFLFYPNDIWSFNAGINSIQENFKPTLGFVNRSNFKRIYSELEFEPRFKKMPGVEFEAGSFYTGKRSNIEMYLNLSLNRHLSFGLDWSHNTLDMPQGDFKVNEFGGRVNYALNPKLNSSLFAQWNNEDDEVILNYRINWIPKIGSFFYFVVNQNIDTANNTLKLTRTTILAKLIWRFAGVALVYLNVLCLCKLLKLNTQVAGRRTTLLPQIYKICLLKRNEQRHYCQPQLRMQQRVQLLKHCSPYYSLNYSP